MPFMQSAVLQDKTLFISAGHSDSDPGATSEGFTEADFVLQFRDLVAAELRRKRVVFGQDGIGSQNLPLGIATKMAAKHDVAVEFHCNAAASPRATGVETLSDFHRHPLLGKLLCEAVSTTLGVVNRGDKPEYAGQHSRLAFVSDGGGVIVELFFITNPDDRNRFLRKRWELAKAVADVLLKEVSEV